MIVPLILEYLVCFHDEVGNLLLAVHSFLAWVVFRTFG
jgi:hypothetical protein